MKLTAHTKVHPLASRKYKEWIEFSITTAVLHESKGQLIDGLSSRVLWDRFCREAEKWDFPCYNSETRVSNPRPAGQFQPVSSFYLACKESLYSWCIIKFYPALETYSTNHNYNSHYYILTEFLLAQKKPFPTMILYLISHHLKCNGLKNGGPYGTVNGLHVGPS